MRVSYIKNVVDVLGFIWMPNGVPCAATLEPTSGDLANMREYAARMRLGDDIDERYVTGDHPTEPITRDAVRDWLDTNAGDFSEIIDFAYNLGDDEYMCHFDTEDNYLTWSDCWQQVE